MKNSLNGLKNLLWAAAILLCLLAMVVAFIFSMSLKNTQERPDGTLVLGQIERGPRNRDVDIIGTEGGATLNELAKSSTGTMENVFGMTFLCDETLLGLKAYASQYAENIPPQIWTDDGSGLRAKDAAETPIVFVDGSLYTADTAIAVTHPQTIVLYLGADSLAQTSEKEFIDGYIRLITSLRNASPSTNIIVCSIASISSNYQGTDGLTTQLISRANAWIRQVCISTGVYFADLASFLNDEYGYLSDAYLMPDGRSVSAAGIALVVDYFRSHYM